LKDQAAVEPRLATHQLLNDGFVVLCNLVSRVHQLDERAEILAGEREG
jgi:hypothetical protein